MYEELEQLVMQQQHRGAERIQCFEQMGMRRDQIEDIELFILIQAIGLVEAIQREAVTTCLSKQSVFSFRLVQSLQDLHIDSRITGLLLKGAEMKSDGGKLTEEVKETSERLREEAFELLKDVIARRSNSITPCR